MSLGEKFLGETSLGEMLLGEMSFCIFRVNVIRGNVVRGTVVREKTWYHVNRSVLCFLGVNFNPLTLPLHRALWYKIMLLALGRPATNSRDRIDIHLKCLCTRHAELAFDACN
jgi:hypothetical protein